MTALSKSHEPSLVFLRLLFFLPYITSKNLMPLICGLCQNPKTYAFLPIFLPFLAEGSAKVRDVFKLTTLFSFFIFKDSGINPIKPFSKFKSSHTS